MLALQLFQRLDQALVRCGILYNHLSLAIDGQQLGATRPPESLEVGLCVSGEICE